MRFSLILPTRRRETLLTNFLHSLSKTTKHKHEVEVLIAYDHDDKDTNDALDNLVELCPFACFYCVPRADNFSRDYYTWLAHNSSGEYIIACNDDIEVRTPNWDEIAYDKLTQFQRKHARDGICYGWIDDSYRHPQGFSCFPLISRKAFHVLGYYFPEEMPTWGADCELYKLFACVDRVCRLDEVLFHHVSPHTQTREPDEQNARVQELDKRGSYDYRGEIKRLRKIIKGWR